MQEKILELDKERSNGQPQSRDFLWSISHIIHFFILGRLTIVIYHCDTMKKTSGLCSPFLAQSLKYPWNFLIRVSFVRPKKSLSIIPEFMLMK